MADYMAAEIHIGGKVPSSVAEALCKVINDTRASLEWGGGACDFRTAENLLAAASANTDELEVLVLYDDQARWGQFEELETFLREHGIAYCRLSDGKYEYDPEVVCFHPQTGLRCLLTDHEQNPVVLISQLRPILAKLQILRGCLQRGRISGANALNRLDGIIDAFQAELPPEVPDLEPLEIVKG